MAIIDIEKQIFSMKTIAVVGMSTSHTDRKLCSDVYADPWMEIIPVNPTSSEISGLTCYATLKDIPFDVDIVNVFRRPEYTFPRS